MAHDAAVLDGDVFFRLLILEDDTVRHIGYGAAVIYDIVRLDWELHLVSAAVEGQLLLVVKVVRVFLVTNLFLISSKFSTSKKGTVDLVGGIGVLGIYPSRTVVGGWALAVMGWLFANLEVQASHGKKAQLRVWALELSLNVSGEGTDQASEAGSNKGEESDETHNEKSGLLI